jgi:predicted PurR-regulated permease PerM
MAELTEDKTQKSILIFFFFVLVIYLISLLSSLLIPLVLAFLCASLFQPFALYLKRKKFPGWLILPVIAIVTLLILFLIFQIAWQTGQEISSQQSYLLERLNIKLDSVFAWIDSITQKYFKTSFNFEFITSQLNPGTISSLVGRTASTIGDFTGSFFIFVLYYVALLASMPRYKAFLEYVSGNNINSRFVRNYESIQQSIISYMKIKTAVSLVTGLLTSVVCLIFGIKFAFFWGLLAFILNFIPTIGSIIAVVPPFLMAVIQFDSAKIMILLLVCLVAVQNVMGNVVEPIIMGNRLRLNTLTVIFGLVFWGYIWGIWGMFLSVPLLVLFKIIMEQIPELSMVSRLMGTTQSLSK